MSKVTLFEIQSKDLHPVQFNYVNFESTKKVRIFFHISSAKSEFEFSIEIEINIDQIAES